MVDFLKLKAGENKEEYKKRIATIIKNTLMNINGNKDDLIDIITLLYCANNNLTKAEKKLENGNEFDYEKYIMAKFINNLDEENYFKVRREVEDLIINKKTNYEKVISEYLSDKYSNCENNSINSNGYSKIKKQCVTR